MNQLRPRFIVVVGILALVLASGAAMAADRACFSWSDSATVGTINFDASGSSATSPDYIYWYVWNFGDGTGGGPSGVATTSHTYAPPGPYDLDATLTVTYLPSGNVVSVTCHVFIFQPPFGPLYPGAGSCCSS